MSTTSPGDPYGSGFGSSPSMSGGSAAGSSTSTSGSSTGSADTSETPLTNGADYYGMNGSSYAAGSSRSSTSSTSSGSGASRGSSDSTASGTEWSSDGASSGSGYADTQSSLSRGAVTTRTGPMQRTAGDPSAGLGAAASTGTHAAARRTPRKHKGPRRVRLAVARVDPWSVMKMSFLLSVALGIAGVVLTAVLWMILSTMNVFTDVEGVLQSLQTTTQDPFSIKDYVGFGRVVSLSIVIGVIDIILLTAISTVMAFLYNICSALVGGIQLTLTDD
jgi:hypothetical protein